jgi:predicted nuclease with TOPRIM domain
MPQQDIVERIIDLSSKALSEKDRGKFTDYLKERSALMAQLTDDGVEAGEGALKAWLGIEQEIMTRLEEERRHVLEEMENLSRRRTAVHHYSPKFPFPPIPVFFDKIG